MRPYIIALSIVVLLITNFFVTQWLLTDPNPQKQVCTQGTPDDTAELRHWIADSGKSVEEFVSLECLQQ